MDFGTLLTSSTLDLPRGRWRPPLDAPGGHLGYVVLAGVLLRETCIGRDWSAELLGEGDVLRPWLEDSSSFADSRWEVVEATRLAVLEPPVAQRLREHPAVLEELFERALRRSRAMAIHAVIEGVHRIDERLLLLLWHVAERLGRRENGSIIVPLHLTHEQLSRLVGARRPTVTTALGKLEADGRIERTAAGWILRGDPPGAPRARS